MHYTFVLAARVGEQKRSMHKGGHGASSAGGCDMDVAAAYAAGDSYAVPATPQPQWWQRERVHGVRPFSDSTVVIIN